MSNSIGNNLLHQSLLPWTVLESQRRISSSCVAGNTLLSSQATSGRRNSSLLSEFCGSKLNVQKNKLFKGEQRANSLTPRAVLAPDSTTAEMMKKFSLDGNIELQVEVRGSTASSPSTLDFKVTSSSNTLFLHWGGLHAKKGKWVLPNRRPDGTKVYKDRALRTPFVSSGAIASLRVEIDDPMIQAIEFLIFDEAQNKWFKNNGENFHIKLPAGDQGVTRSIPEDLVQIQAYIRWERKGKQMYTPEKEKEEYEAARTELLEELAKGTSVQEIRARLTKKPEAKENKDSFTSEMIKIEETKKELELGLEKGTTVKDIKEKNPRREIQTKNVKQVERKRYSSVERIQRKTRDIMQLCTKYPSGSVEESSFSEPQALSAVERFAKEKEDQVDVSIVNRKIYDLAGAKLLVLVMRSSGNVKLYLVTDLKEPVILHWALSMGQRKWSVPPSSVVPEGSSLIGEAVETQFSSSHTSDLTCKVRSLELEFEDGDFVGMPFVILSDGHWVKDKGSDFYVEFGADSKPLEQSTSDGSGTAKALLDKIAGMESEAQKSFMHRFNIAADLMQEATSAGKLGVAAILVWMRYMATRQLTWNKNYNVKPREISKAQDRLTDILQHVYTSSPQFRELVRLIMSVVGRGGEGDVGQRIRDEILVIQRKNNLGGMMEEWHQKLHNNTSPDDVVICQALIDYIKSDMDINAYWKTLKENGITKERLLSYDRAIHSEPNFRKDQKDSLLHDLGNYLRTLKAVHSGADLESAISNCMGYKAEGEGFMVGVRINPVPGLPSGFQELLHFVLEHIEDKNVEPLLECLLEARQELRPLLSKPTERLKDLIFLDIALDSSVRTSVERGYEELNSSGPEKVMHFISLVIENLALSVDNNEDLIYCLKGWDHALNMLKNGDEGWALFAKSVLDRTRLALASKAEWYNQLLQPSADYLGSKLGLDQWAVSIFTEEMIRAGSAAPLSVLLNRLDPILRQTAHLGSWQIISPVEAVGYVVVVNELLSVQNKSYERPVILVARSVKGEEEIPDGTVAVITPDMPDVLSHVSVRARNSKVCFATCFDSNILTELQSKEGKLLRLRPTSADILYSEVAEEELASSSNLIEIDSSPSIALHAKKFGGKFAISSEEFTNETVGAKSRNIAFLKEKVPSWIGIPNSVALPFGVFEKVLSDDLNQEVASKIEALKKRLNEGDVHSLGEIRKTVLNLKAPPQLISELKDKMLSAGMSWPGDEGQDRWKQAWMAIKKVWASKWNERAYFSTRKVKLDHDKLCMAVLVQEIINADYAFVIHTTNPSSNDSSEIYAEVVKGLGETLVGAYPGRALGFSCKKNNLTSPQVLGYPSKPIGLFLKRTIIFRSDSNGEDLEGYAGAGLYDSVPMDEEEEVVLDYTLDPLIIDSKFRQQILSDVARAGSLIEELYGSPQDIEGVVRDGKVYVVQTRPQMSTTRRVTMATSSSLISNNNERGGGLWELRFEYKNCNCGKKAAIRIVDTNDTPTKGMLYFACDEEACGFWTWCTPINVRSSRHGFHGGDGNYRQHLSAEDTLKLIKQNLEHLKVLIHCCMCMSLL